MALAMYTRPDGRLSADEFAVTGTGYHHLEWDGRRHLILVLPGGHYRVVF